MNLVQINERLKGLPEQVIRQYANGMNPEVPPYLALGELQRRELSNKQMATAQGAAQGPQPSIKEQIEQRAGLMGLQQMQQQQMAQQQSQPRGPMPAPAGVPQPEQQPEAMMARGGLASIPVRRDMFEYAGGGIIAFSGEEGSQVKNPRVINLPKGTPYDEVELIRLQNPDAIVRTEDEGSKFRDIGQAIKRGLTYSSDVEAMKERSKAPPRMASPQPDTQTYTRKSGAMPTPEAPVSDLKALAEQKRIQQAPPPAAPPAAPQGGLPGAAAAMTPQNEISKLALDAVRTPAKAMTPEEAMAQEGKFASQYGLDKKFGEEERGLLALMKQRQADYAQRRPMEELGATLRGFGQGYGGASAAGERAGRETYEMDMANQREALNAINALNKENRDTGKERYKTSSTLFGKSEESASAANRERVQSLARLADVSERSIQAQLDRLNNMQVAKLRSVENTTAGERVTAQYLKLKAENKPAEAEALLEAHLRVTKGGEKEGVLAQEIAKKKVDIAAMPDNPLKQQMMASLAALEKQGGGAAVQTGKVPPPPPGFKLN